MQKKNKFIAHLILEIKLTHDLAKLWACPEMPGHNFLKLLKKFATSMDV